MESDPEKLNALLGEIFDIFILIMLLVEKSSHQSAERDTGKVPLIRSLTADSDWCVTIGQDTRWRWHPWINTAHSWADMDETLCLGTNEPILFKFKSL